MIIVRGPDRKQLNTSFKACLRNKRKPKKEPESGSRSKATVCFIVNQERSNNRLKLYLRINSLALDDEKTVRFTATDTAGRKVKGHYVPPISAKERLLLSPNKYEGIGKLEYVDD